MKIEVLKKIISVVTFGWFCDVRKVHAMCSKLTLIKLCLAGELL
jgi:hypothetical protein